MIYNSGCRAITALKSVTLIKDFTKQGWSLNKLSSKNLDHLNFEWNSNGNYSRVSCMVTGFQFNKIILRLML